MQIERYLKEYAEKDLLRFITCGSVDDGKSTLIGRLLYDTKTVFEDQILAVEHESRKYGTTGEAFDLALLVDGLQSEREQGITIDVAYRFFSTEHKKYIIADTPGHEQYTRNMVTGASTADLAIILIDARKGVLTQTRRHSYIVNLLGIKHIVVAINKMDLVDYDADRFEEIVQSYRDEVADKLDLEEVHFVPISALVGDNIVHRSERMPWYSGKSLIELLDSIEIGKDENNTDLRFLVQYVNRPNLNFRGFSGTIASGTIREGDEIIVFPSKKRTKVKSIVAPYTNDGKEEQQLHTITEASVPMAVTITTEDEIDISRSDVIVHPEHSASVTDKVDAIIVWMDEKDLVLKETYGFKGGAYQSVLAEVETIHYAIDVNTFAYQPSQSLGLNDIAHCRISLSQPIVCDAYKEIKRTGSFILIDKITNRTVGAGMIVSYEIAEDESVTQGDISDFEKELNALVRKYFPNWGVPNITQLRSVQNG